MKTLNIEIEISGPRRSGKSKIGFLIKKFLRKNGVNVNFISDDKITQEYVFDKYASEYHDLIDKENIVVNLKIINTNKMKTIDAKVFPSDEKTIHVTEDVDYGGAHKYTFNNCLGFSDGKTQYNESSQTIQFVQKNKDGSMTPGLQSEQLVLALIDRQEKLNAIFPSPFNEKALVGLNMFLEAQRERVEDRMSRGVMGDLKK